MRSRLPPHAVRSTLRLLLEDLGSKVAVKSEEVGQLRSRVDLSLPHVLALAEHSSSNKLISVLGDDQLGGFQEDRRPVDERCVLPALLSLQRGVDSGSNLLLGREREVGELLSVGVGHNGVERLGGGVNLAIVEKVAACGEFRLELVQGLLQLGALRRAFPVLRLRRLLAICSGTWLAWASGKLTLGSFLGSGSLNGTVALVLVCCRPTGTAKGRRAPLIDRAGLAMTLATCIVGYMIQKCMRFAVRGRKGL